MSQSGNIFSKAWNGQRRNRRKSDKAPRSPESTVLQALHVMARKSSPHKATTRANMARAISVIEASMLGLCHIEELIGECQSLCRSGMKSDDSEKRALLADRYAEVIVELNNIAEGTGHAGYHLLGESSSVLEVDLGEPNRFTLKLPRINLTAGPRGLALPKPARAFENAESLTQFERHLSLVKARLEKSAAIFQEHAADLAERLALVLEGTFPEDAEPEKPEPQPRHGLSRRAFRR